jgi:hypothetical protein
LLLFVITAKSKNSNSFQFQSFQSPYCRFGHSSTRSPSNVLLAWKRTSWPATANLRNSPRFNESSWFYSDYHWQLVLVMILDISGDSRKAHTFHRRRENSFLRTPSYPTYSAKKYRWIWKHQYGTHQSRALSQHLSRLLKRRLCVHGFKSASFLNPP